MNAWKLVLGDRVRYFGGRAAAVSYRAKNMKGAELDSEEIPTKKAELLEWLNTKND